MGLDKSTIMKVSRGNMILDRHGKQQQIDTQKIEHKKISSNMEDSNLMKKSKQINKANKEVEEQINIKDD